MKVGLTLMKNLLTSLAKNVSIPVELTTAASVTNTAVKKENYELWITAMIMSNKELKDTIKITKFFQECDLLWTGANKNLKWRRKRTKKWISLHIIRCWLIRISVSMQRSYLNWWRSSQNWPLLFILVSPLANFEIHKCCQKGLSLMVFIQEIFDLN